jgi:NAD-dependent DNA ligase
MKEIDIEEAIKNFQTLIGNLMYICYKYNRDRNPEIPPEKYTRLFVNADEMEAVYQVEKKIESEPRRDH